MFANCATCWNARCCWPTNRCWTPPPSARRSALQPLPELPRAADDRPVGDFQQAREAFERDLIGRALAQSAGNVVEAAKRLGLGRSTLYKKIVALGMRLDNGTHL